MTLWLYRQILILKGIRALSLTDESVFCTEETIMLLVHTENNLCILCTALTTFKAISLFKDILDNKHWQEFDIRSFRMWQIKGRLCHLCCSSTYLSVMLSHVERITIFIQMRCDTYAVHRIVCVRKRHYKWKGTCLPEFLLTFHKIQHDFGILPAGEHHFTASGVCWKWSTVLQYVTSHTGNTGNFWILEHSSSPQTVRFAKFLSCIVSIWLRSYRYREMVVPHWIHRIVNVVS